MNTKQLIKQCQLNNYSAQLQVYNAYKNMMFGAAVRILKSKEEAEDVVQDCFIKGFKKIHQLKEDANLGAWLKRIVVNKSLDVIKEKKKIVWVDEILTLEDVVAEENEVTDAISIDFIKNCIHQLKEKYSIILTLYLIEDYNHREIGELLNIKESTVRNQYKRGKQQLLLLIKK
ncbi:RNA polymerase sigma factor [Polaribacter vadi]|uniref:RNA polymerase sigma factor n=1 Tax=Polaribacter TaxID=52959 RepID=UPI001C088E30|nr:MULTISPECIES: RNA polymerase sigma factor [Polaribacter]MBU3011915.1 RNA polymerase sigma factor [Polaribacter vadi]MDO6741730.1 RNA polymerase sigma factor [Polaribacter sp. 1_MG-2023]